MTAILKTTVVQNAASTTPNITLDTSGNVAIGTGLGVGASPSYGTSGQVLTSAGAGAAPTWSTPSSGAMALISTQTASASTYITWTGLSGYDRYLLMFNNVNNNGGSNGRFALQVGYGAKIGRAHV